ncbi:FAD-dependent thymidylate synthase [Candidatus Saccharibacteria bacterium]|nr:FAD-dependent thymidylate synthase [Candidatus Saccharibacteria bacterium]
MQPNQGIFIVLEGTDGSGKGTQFKLLKDRLLKNGYQVSVFDFPQYDSESSFFVREYLNAKYGTAEEVGPYTGSLFYALDRYQAAPKIREALAKGHVVLANRFTGSNMAHQGTKFNNLEERKGFFFWLDNLEFVMLKIPRPNMNVVLRVPADIAQKLVDQKEARSYTDKKRDIHEADISHMQKSVEVYDDLCNMFPKDFMQIDCVRNDKLLDIEIINNILWETVLPMLPTLEKNAIDKKDQPLLLKDQNGHYTITAEGSQFLSDSITDSTGNVYAFTNNLSPTMIAAAMARLSRRGDDMRITLLDEFAGQASKDEKLLQRVITAYGDDSVQQLVGVHLVVENASNLLTKKLEWGRLAAYLEQSTRYIFFDQKDEKGKYKYLVPAHFDDQTKQTYVQSLDTIFDKYSEMVRKLTDYVRANSDTPESEQDVAWKGATRAQACDAIRPVLPVATKATVGIYASGQALESLIMHLQSDQLPEAVQTGDDLLKQARKIIPTFLERADRPDRGGAIIAYRANTYQGIKDIADKYLPGQYGQHEQPVTLTDIWPRNELELVPDMLYEHSHLSLQEIKKEVSKWSYQQKTEVFNKYFGERLNRRHKPGRALEKAHYSWDLVCDYGIFRDLQRHRMVDDLQWQILTPRYGYEVPELVVEAGLEDLFQDCFDISLQLHSTLISAGYELEAQYATLLGHKMRWKITYNAREAFHLHELRTSPQGHPGYRKLVLDMHKKVAEQHPLLAGAMRFVNTSEDEQLTRLAAEKYTQFKLSQLS